MENAEANSEMTWKIWKKSKLKCEKRWIQRKGKLNSENIGKMGGGGVDGKIL
jgi:hypothetical protein